jgi:DNA-binding transcriptional regulator YhcF (GntR family)
MLKKKEIVYREILTCAIEKRQFSFTQLALSKKFGFSLSTISNALSPLERIGAIEKKTRSFSVVDVKKMLVFWASERNLKRDIVYQTRFDSPIQKIEGLMPSSVIYSAFSAYRMKFDDAPADYGEVYVYADKKTLEEIQERFPKTKGPVNIIVLEKDPSMPDGSFVPLPQIYVDLWNIRDWYAKDYLDALSKRLNL